MDGEVQSDSSSGQENESETGEQSVTDEMLENLKNLTQMVGELKGEVEDNKKSLEQLKNNFSSLASSGSLGNLGITEPKVVSLEVDKSTIVQIPENAKIIIIKRDDSHLANTGFNMRIDKDSWTSEYLGYFSGESNYVIPIPSGFTKITFATPNQPGNTLRLSYCFIVLK